MNKVSMIKIGVLTSSRADYGIYRPLLKRLTEDQEVDLTVLAFGMHLEKQYGLTLGEIQKDAFGEILTIEGMPEDDSQQAIAAGYGNLIVNFSKVWDRNDFDLVLALGDRFEMSAAVQSSIPFGIRLGHIHAGETTLGANDEIYRHQISLASEIFFVSTEKYAKNVARIKGHSENIHNVGALSLDGILNIQLPDWSSVSEKFDIPHEPFVLITFHPETTGIQDVTAANQALYQSLYSLSEQYQLVITLPNADYRSKLILTELNKLKEQNARKVSLIKNFGKVAYFTAMKSAEFLLGNTSSGIIEAASFGKYVINVGNRQKGRAQSKNIFNVPYDVDEIEKAVTLIKQLPEYRSGNVYEGEAPAEEIARIIKATCRK